MGAAASSGDGRILSRRFSMPIKEGEQPDHPFLRDYPVKVLPGNTQTETSWYHALCAGQDTKNSNMLPEMTLRVHYEALVLLNLEEKPLEFFPYHTVMCWGHSLKTFQFRIFNKTGEPTTIQLASTQGKEIEQTVLKAVKSLMEDMEKKGVSDAEFKNLCSTVSGNASVGIDTVQQFTVSRSFTARQAVDLLKIIETSCPFSKVDMAVLLYDRMIQQGSFEMLLNCFDNKEDKENVCHRLGLALPDK